MTKRPTLSAAFSGGVSPLLNGARDYNHFSHDFQRPPRGMATKRIQIGNVVNARLPG